MVQIFLNYNLIKLCQFYRIFLIFTTYSVDLKAPAFFNFFHSILQHHSKYLMKKFFLKALQHFWKIL